ncbi:MAG TPA: hypothetical protein VI434_13690 [Candidatus Dormibacteraeota bacterium]
MGLVVTTGPLGSWLLVMAVLIGFPVGLAIKAHIDERSSPKAR